MGTEPPLVLHVVNSLTAGGTELFLLRLLRAFDSNRFRHAVVTLRDAGALAAELPDHVACWSINAVNRSWTTGLTLRRIGSTWRPAIVHARNTGCWMDAITATMGRGAVKLVLGFHGLDRDGPLTRRQARVARWGVLQGASFLSVAEAGRQRLAEEAGVPPERIAVIRNGVDLREWPRIEESTRAGARARLGISDRSFVIGTAVSLTAVKRPEVIVELVHALGAQIHDVHGIIIGDGPLRCDVERLIEQRGLRGRVHLLGHRENVADELAALDVYVCPSASEAMSNALLEAMALGLPVVSTDVGDHGLLVRPQAGVIVPVHDFDALRDAVERLLLSAEERRAFSAAARARAAQFGLAGTVAAYERCYDALLAGVRASQRPNPLPYGRGTDCRLGRSLALPSA